mmetsp:Transcript_5572/g.13961  ORF Transcript_5572/g.13961 Transcript_5572/m.13961 type:complete len:125 (-) Transcript_5572:431-805(-)
MKLNLSQKPVVNHDMMVEEGRHDTPYVVKDQGMALHIRLGDNQEEARDDQTYLVGVHKAHFFRHSDQVDLDAARVASDDSDEDDEVHENDHEERQGFRYSNDVHEDGGMDRVVDLLTLHAYHDD